MARITDTKILMDRVVKMLPKGIPADAIQSVECDPTDGTNGGPSYWVYLNDGYISPEMGCQTIHEDNLKELKAVVSCIEEDMSDPKYIRYNCPVCGKVVYRHQMQQTRDCHGIPYRFVCDKCYEDIMDYPGYDGVEYTEADECIDEDY